MTSSALNELRIQDVARRTGFSEATLRYYEHVGLIPPVPRDPSSHHRRFPAALVEQLEALACLRASGLGVNDMKAYVEGLAYRDGQTLVALFIRHAEQLDSEIEDLHRRRRYVASKARLWQARLDHDPDAEASALEAAAAAGSALRTGA